MNSMSRTHCNDDKDDDNRKHREKEAAVLLKCKASNSVTVTANTDDAVTRRIATLTLNTDRFCIPCIKFEFSTNVTISTDPGNVRAATINFQLFKLCRRETVPTPIGGEWIFTGARFPGSAIDTSNDIITFIVCDCDCDCDCDKDDCCTYFVEATAIANAAGESSGTATVTFNNSTLSALVVEKTTRCC